jgi:hypothetical protein
LGSTDQHWVLLEELKELGKKLRLVIPERRQKRRRRGEGEL